MRTTEYSVSGVGGVPKRAFGRNRLSPNLATVVGTSEVGIRQLVDERRRSCPAASRRTTATVFEKFCTT